LRGEGKTSDRDPDTGITTDSSGWEANNDADPLVIVATNDGGGDAGDIGLITVEFEIHRDDEEIPKADSAGFSLDPVEFIQSQTDREVVEIHPSTSLDRIQVLLKNIGDSEARESARRHFWYISPIRPRPVSSIDRLIDTA
jgi:hypothetical protein